MDLGGRAHWSMTDTVGFFIFTDRGGDRIERAVLGGEAEAELYDIFGTEADLTKKGLAPTPTGSTTPGLSHSVADRSETRKPGYVFQRGDLLSWDLGIRYLNFGTDYKRKAYILKEGETDIPPGLKLAWERVLKAREIIKKNIKVGLTAGETLKVLARALEEEGYVYTPFVNYGARDREIINSLGDDKRSGVSIDCHCVGNYGFSQVVEGPSISPFRHRRAPFTIQQNNLFAFEFMVHTWVPEWGKRHSINLEDNAIVTEKGVEFLYPPNERIILIR